jgi:hypothetical protein
MTIIDRIIDFLTELDPTFPAAIRGSTPEQIAALARAMGREPSPLHCAFLERMGESLGPVSLGPYAVSPDALLEHDPRMIAGLPEAITLFAVPLGDNDPVFLLDGDDPEVVRHPSVPYADDSRLAPELTDPAAGSLSELLCLPLVLAREVAPKPHQATYAEKERRDDTLARCRHLAALFGFEPYWFSNASTFAAHRGSLVLVAKQARGYFFSCGLAGDDVQDFGVVFRTLTRELDLAIFR